MERRYPALRFVGSVFRVWAAVVFLGGIVGTLVALSNDESLSSSDKLSYYVGGILAAAFTAAFIYAVGELISVFIDTEANTRRAATFAEALYEDQGRDADPLPPPDRPLRAD